MKDVRVVVGGFLGLLPAGGVTWDYVQYPLGFKLLGCDVYYIEDTRLWPVYQTDDPEGADCTRNVEHLRALMDAFDMGDRWAYRDEKSGECFGMSLERVKEVCRSADVFVNVSCSTFMREEYSRIPARALIDSDPMFTQIQYRTQEMFTKGEPTLRRLVGAHSHHFTFGENFGAEDCRMPACGIDWRPTRQPICLLEWPMTPPTSEASAAYTTVMNWTAAKTLEYEGETWGQKNGEFLRFMDIPSRVPGVPFAVAVGQTIGDSFPVAEAEAHGWRVLDPVEHVPEWLSYRRFISASRGEFSIAKETYIKGNTGWFSCRSACYLAAARPVVTQETGWSRYIPSGEGLIAFRDLDEAAAAIETIESEPQKHALAARRIAEEYFDSDRVLRDFLDHCSGTPNTSP